MSDIVEVMKAVRAELDAKGIKLDVDVALRELAGDDPVICRVCYAVLPISARGVPIFHSDFDCAAEVRKIRADLAAARELNVGAMRAELRKAEPIPILISCPDCGTRHVDVGEFATKPHHTHACQTCGLVWRPAIGPTVGVRFLPGF